MGYEFTDEQQKVIRTKQAFNTTIIAVSYDQFLEMARASLDLVATSLGRKP